LSSDRPRSLKSVIVVRPPALPLIGNNSKNRTVSWCLPGNLGCLFDFLIRSSRPDRSRRSREVQRIPQPCCLKKERGCSSSARAPYYMKQLLNHWAILTRGSPWSDFYSQSKRTVKHENPKKFRLLKTICGGCNRHQRGLLLF